MLTLIAALVGGYVVGFAGSRALRRPQRSAQVASAARTVSGSVGGRRGLTLPELQRACFSEMMRHVRVGRDGRTQAPGRYQLRMHPDDLAQVDEARGWFVDGLVEALHAAAADEGWAIAGTVDVAFEADPSRRRGVPTALAVAPGESRRAEPSAAPAPSRPAAVTSLRLRRADTGATTALDADELVIGRADDVDLRIDDKRVSRRHAAVRRGRGRWSVTDLGSANGTTCNGRLLSPQAPQPIQVGDTVGIGPFELVVEPHDGPAPGSRALDDRDRTRISGEVLRPRRDEP
ncbi:MAG: DUF3662 domain-containing protein [Acidimicrobiales bacterium]|nr:DUF3662 domain-containing protein [Acidimicrobiales bacterium]